MTVAMLEAANEATSALIQNQEEESKQNDDAELQNKEEVKEEDNVKPSDSSEEENKADQQEDEERKVIDSPLYRRYKTSDREEPEFGLQQDGENIKVQVKW